MTYDKPNTKYVIPSEGAIRGSDTMVVTSGAPHPIAANLWIDFNLDAQISAANSNYIGYLGPNAAAMADHRPDAPRQPEPQPAGRRLRQADRARSSSRAPTSTSTPSAGTRSERRPVADVPLGERTARRSAPRPAPRRRGPARGPGRLRRGASSSLPGVVWLGAFFLVPLVDHPGRQPRARTTRPATSTSSVLSLAQLRPGDPPRVPAGVRQLAPLRRC